MWSNTWVPGKSSTAKIIIYALSSAVRAMLWCQRPRWEGVRSWSFESELLVRECSARPMIRLVARIVDQSDGAFQQTLLMQKTLVNIHSLTGLTVFFLSSVAVFRFPYQQPMNEISQQGRSDFAFDLRLFLPRTFYRQSPSSTQHTLFNARLLVE